MTCESCEGEMKATQVTNISDTQLKVGSAVALGGVVTFGALLGVVLALMGSGGVDLSWALIATPIALLMATPLVIVGIRRVSLERNIWLCAQCGHSLDRT